MENKKTKHNLTVPPALWKIIGPSIILLGLGLGSGEIILWPYLVSNFGLGIIWAAVIGITFQFFINMEIERYSLIKGESIFVGFRKILKGAPYWFLFSTFIAWIWPGIIAASAKILANLLGIERFDLLAIALLILIGIILTLGPTLYKTVEGFQKILISIGIPAIALITFFIAKSADWEALKLGLVGIGEGYSFLPAEIPLLTFLGALAYSGAGGNLNLAQSFYIKEKGYAMCKGTRGISSVLTGRAQKIELEGKTFELTDENRKNFKKWWRIVNLEHFLVFLLTGAISIILLALLAYSSVRGLGSNIEGINFILNEAKSISYILSPLVGGLFLTLTGLMLFGTQLTVLDSTSRIMAENVVILKKEANLSKTYYLILWLQILAGVAIFSAGFSEPLTLVVIGAVINAIAMFVHIGITYLLNTRALPKVLHPSSLRKVIIFVIWLFFGTFSFYSIWSVLV